MLAISFTSLILWSAAIGACGAVFGAHRWAKMLMAPAVVTFLITPLLAPFAAALLQVILHQWWLLPPLMVAAAVAVPVMIIRVWTKLLRVLWGDAGVHVAGLHIHSLLRSLFGRRRGRAMPELDDGAHH